MFSHWQREVESEAFKGLAPNLVRVQTMAAHDVGGGFCRMRAARAFRGSAFLAAKESLTNATLIKVVFDDPLVLVQRGVGHGIRDADPVNLVGHVMGDVSFLDPVGVKREHRAVVVKQRGSESAPSKGVQSRTRVAIWRYGDRGLAGEGRRLGGGDGAWLAMESARMFHWLQWSRW